MTHRHALLDTLQANGVALITGSPGTEWVVVLDALAEARANGEPVPRYVNCRHETVAVAIAHGYGRYTGKVAAVLLHSAVGPLHAAMAIRAAYHAKSPLLLLGGDALTSDHDAIGNSGWIWVSRLADTQSSSSFVKIGRASCRERV